MREAPSILRKALESARGARRDREPFLAVFDLDSTLYDLTGRVQKIIETFAHDPERRKKYPEACEKTLAARIHPQDWGLKEGLGRAGLREADHPDFFSELHSHWLHFFFNNAYLGEDRPMPGAVEFVRALENEGAHIMYLTGRDTGRMRDGTLASLRAWGFPLGHERARLLLKPEPGLNDARFKLSVLQNEVRAYRHVWLFENEPVNLNLVRENCPGVNLVFIETTHSGRERAAPELARVPHFETDWLCKGEGAS